MKEPANTLIEQPKKHFDTLDGLRGVAALSVVVFHFMEWVQPEYRNSFIGHGFMAVDFFFCLSGFVIGYAYDQRIIQMGRKAFFVARLIRLHPLVIFGAVWGLIQFLINASGPASVQYTNGEIIILFLCSIFLIPYPVMKDRAFNLFGLNTPGWSLFWEYVANIVYAFVLVKLNRLLLLIVTIAAALLLCFVAWRSGNLLGGWSGGTFWEGGARVAYSFSAGLLIYRYGWVIKNKLGFGWLSLLLLLVFLSARFTSNWWCEALIVIVYFPLLIALGAGSQPPAKLAGICTFSGRISYPLYMTHYAGVWVFGNYVSTHTISTTNLVLIITSSTLLLTGFAWLVMLFYDEPVRKWLTNKFRQSK